MIDIVGIVTSHVGVWIETGKGTKRSVQKRVTSHVGVWIETKWKYCYFVTLTCHISCRCVD